MDHLAILSKKRKLLAKILSGEKTIESRWYRFKRTPYKNIIRGDTIYFKESGGPVMAKAKVSQVFFFDDLSIEKIEAILEKYGQQIGISKAYAKELRGKKFCTLMFIKDVESVEPFDVNKKGYGMMAAWITLKEIETIRKRKGI